MRHLRERFVNEANSLMRLGKFDAECPGLALGYNDPHWKQSALGNGGEALVAGEAESSKSSKSSKSSTAANAATSSTTASAAAPAAEKKPAQQALQGKELEEAFLRQHDWFAANQALLQLKSKKISKDLDKSGGER